VRLVLLSAGAVKEIALGEISGFAPDGGIFLSFGTFAGGGGCPWDDEGVVPWI